ncbi:MAG TPA: hypothetical protein VGH65_09550 [Verrucomicrobiaceae bacterium]|jgi:hypothetical protein
MNRLIAMILAGSSIAFAADNKKKSPVDPDLPQPLDSTVAQPLLDSSPFTRALNLSDSLTLTGIAYIQGKPVATIFDKNKKTSHVVSEEPNAQGWKLAEASAFTTVNRSIAKIMVGNEIVTVRYSSEQLTPEDKKNSERRGPPGAEGGGPPRREYYRPSPEDDERRRHYESMSDQGKEKVRNFFRDSRDKLMNATPEERTAYIKQNFERIMKEEPAGR